MTFYTLKVIKGQEYVYMEERGRVDGKTVRTFQKYIGPRKDSQIYRSGELKSLHPKIRLILKFANLGWVHHYGPLRKNWISLELLIVIWGNKKRRIFLWENISR